MCDDDDAVCNGVYNVATIGFHQFDAAFVFCLLHGDFRLVDHFRMLSTRFVGLHCYMPECMMYGRTAGAVTGAAVLTRL